MFCKYCGNELDPSNPVCPKCKHPATLSGGNGFWDMAGESKRGIQPPAPEPAREGFAVKETKKPAVLPMAVSAVLCLLCLVMLAAGLSSVRRIKDLNTEWERAISEQRTEYGAHIGELEKRITDMEAALEELSESQNRLEVKHQPSSEEQNAGYKNKDGGCLFMLSVDGQAVSFTWQRKNADGTWSPLSFNSEKTNTMYGLSLEEDLANGVTKLVAAGLAEESEGIYRCTAKGIRGEEVTSEEVSLKVIPVKEGQKERADEPAPPAVTAPSTPALPLPVASDQPSEDEPPLDTTQP